MLVSASSDLTLKLWPLDSPEAPVPRATLQTHTDYVKALAYAPSAGLIVSASLDKMIHIYKLDTLRQVAASGGGGGGSLAGASAGQAIGDWTGTEGGAVPIVASGHKDSIYSVAINAAGTLIASGSVEPEIRLWDGRSGRMSFKLVGHTDVVRALLLDADGKMAISASSDRTIRLWDIGMQRCVHISQVHKDAAWALESRGVRMAGRTSIVPVHRTALTAGHGHTKRTCFRRACLRGQFERPRARGLGPDRRRRVLPPHGPV
mmetsp:Transcript_36719/g.91504  ORF Transcript_36719/g.91504 Transcript_36719/m.91504 type:complete len:262 (-) Transcript_36719:52-837(-)